MSDGTEKSMPSWKLKQIGAKLVAWAIERFGDDFYTRLSEMFSLSDADLDVVMKEVEFYLDRALLRCPHLVEVNDLAEIENALNEAEFSVWSDSAKQVRQKRG